MKGMGFILLASLFWSTDALIRYPLIGEGVPASSIVFIEHLLLVLLFIPYLFKIRKKIWSAQVSHIFYFLIVGGLGSAVATLSFTRAFETLNPSLVILLQKLQPVVAIVLARIVLKEPLRKHFLGWAGLCLAGGLLVSHREIMPGLSKMNLSPALLESNHLKGYLLTMVAIAGWGAATVFGKKLSTVGYRETEIMGGRFLTGFIVLLPMLLSGDISVGISAPAWGKVSVMVLISGLGAMFFYYKGLKLIPARMATLAEMFFPLFAVIVNWIVLGATLDGIQILGGLLLVTGSIVVQIKKY